MQELSANHWRLVVAHEENTPVSLAALSDGIRMLHHVLSGIVGESTSRPVSNNC